MQEEEYGNDDDILQGRGGAGEIAAADVGRERNFKIAHPARPALLVMIYIDLLFKTNPPELL